MEKHARSLTQVLSGLGDVLDGLCDLAQRATDALEAGSGAGRPARVTWGWSIAGVKDGNTRTERRARAAAPTPPARFRAAPVHEVFDEGEFVRTVIELPGVVNDEIRFEVRGQELTVNARRHDGPSTTRLIVPAPVCAERATSSYRNGIFEIQLPKRRPDAGRADGEAPHGAR